MRDTIIRGCVRFDKTQSLTTTQKECARNNIGAVSAADLLNPDNPDFRGFVRFDIDQSGIINDAQAARVRNALRMREFFVTWREDQYDLMTDEQAAVVRRALRIDQAIERGAGSRAGRGPMMVRNDWHFYQRTTRIHKQQVHWNAQRQDTHLYQKNQQFLRQYVRRPVELHPQTQTMTAEAARVRALEARLARLEARLAAAGIAP